MRRYFLSKTWIFRLSWYTAVCWCYSTIHTVWVFVIAGNRIPLGLIVSYRLSISGAVLAIWSILLI